MGPPVDGGRDDDGGSWTLEESVTHTYSYSAPSLTPPLPPHSLAPSLTTPLTLTTLLHPSISLYSLAPHSCYAHSPLTPSTLPHFHHTPSPLTPHSRLHSHCTSSLPHSLTPHSCLHSHCTSPLPHTLTLTALPHTFTLAALPPHSLTLTTLPHSSHPPHSLQLSYTYRGPPRDRHPFLYITPIQRSFLHP